MGVASASYYPDYMNRILGDCDFLIDANEMEAVKKELCDAGYDMSGENNDHHLVFRKGEQDLEMHYDIPGIPPEKLGTLVREYVKDILKETIPFKAQDYIINPPLPKYHGLILLLHMQQHMQTNGIGLRHLMDWCVFVNQTYKEDFWEQDLLPIIKKIGMFKYAQVMTKIGSIIVHHFQISITFISSFATCSILEYRAIKYGSAFSRYNFNFSFVICGIIIPS